MDVEEINVDKRFRKINAPVVGFKKRETADCTEIFNFGGSDTGPFTCFIFLQLKPDIAHRENEAQLVWSYPTPTTSVLVAYPTLNKFLFGEKTPLDSSLDLNLTFVLTNENGVRTYGHCTVFTSGEAVVVLSPYPWSKFFSRLAVLFRVNGEAGKEVVKDLYNCATPPSGAPFIVSLEHGISFTRPYDRLCTFVDTSPDLALRVFETETLLSVLADLILEKHIIVVGHSFSMVSTLIMSLLALVAPFDWMHILIPVLPSSLITVLGAPPPYLVGILDSQLPLLRDVPIESAVTIHISASGKCEKVVYLNETGDTLPFSGYFSALQIGVRLLKMRTTSEHTSRDLCSLFLTYYAALFGKIVLRGPEAYLKEEPGSATALPFFYRLLCTQSYSTLREEVDEIMSKNMFDWLDNEFIVATVRAHPAVFPSHYDILIREEAHGGGYIQRYKECFGCANDFTTWTAAVHGFGGHSVGILGMLSHCLRDFRWCCRFCERGFEEELAADIISLELVPATSELEVL